MLPTYIAVRQNIFSKEVKRENNNWEKCEVRKTFGLAKNILIGAHSTPNQQHYKWAGLVVGQSTENHQKKSCMKNKKGVIPK